MKILLLTMLLALISGVAVQAQNGWSVAANGGIPTGKYSDLVAANPGADVNFLTAVTSNLDLGGSVGYGRFLGKDFETPFGTEEGQEGGFLYRVKGDYKITDMIDLFAMYQGNKQRRRQPGCSRTWGGL